MSKKVNPTAVGIFVTGALIFIVSALILLGAGTLFDTRERFVVYFQTAANGLQEGSDVLLGGVKVGSVVRMRVQIDPATGEKLIPVIIELSADRLAAVTGDADFKKEEFFEPEAIQDSIDQGLRALLKTKSALTGQLYVELDILPDDETGYVFPGKPVDGLMQIPSVKGQIEQVLDKIATSMENFGDIDFKKLVDDLDRTINNIDAKVAELDLKSISDNTNTLLTSADEVVGNDQLKEAIANIDAASKDLKDVIAAVDKEKIDVILDRAATAMDEIGAAGNNLASLTDPEAAVGIRLNRVLSEVNDAARSIKALSDYLRQNPNALITGKKRPR